MSTTLTTTIDESKGRLQFSRYLVMGSEYSLAFVGAGTSTPTLVLTNSAGAIIGQSVAGTLKLNTASMISLFADGQSQRPKSINVYAYADSVVMGAGIAILCWSPLSFESGAEPEIVTGLADAIAAHIADKSNPHVVTAAQAGAAPLYHTHSESGATFPIFQGTDGKFYQIVVIAIGGIPTITLEEYEAP